MTLCIEKTQSLTFKNRTFGKLRWSTPTFKPATIIAYFYDVCAMAPAWYTVKLSTQNPLQMLRKRMQMNYFHYIITAIELLFEWEEKNNMCLLGWANVTYSFGKSFPVPSSWVQTSFEPSSILVILLLKM